MLFVGQCWTVADQAMQPAPVLLLLLLLLQAQRDFFGSHTYQRFDKEGWFHTVWDPTFGSADSITTSGYTA